MTVKETLIRAIDERRTVRILYKGAERIVEPGKPLVLRYGLYVHSGKPGPEALEAKWKEFAEIAAAPPGEKRQAR